MDTEDAEDVQNENDNCYPEDVVVKSPTEHFSPDGNLLVTCEFF